MVRDGVKISEEASKHPRSNNSSKKLLKPEAEIAKKQSMRSNRDDNIQVKDNNKNIKDKRNESFKEKIEGMVAMVNSKTKGDCFKYMIMGLPRSRKEIVEAVRPGFKLFLYDFDDKLLHGVFEAVSKGGMNLEKDAFGGSYPAQVRFKLHLDCLPISEEEFKRAVNGKSDGDKIAFNPELTAQQVNKLIKLFQPNPHSSHPIYAPLVPLRPVMPTVESRNYLSNSEMLPFSSQMETVPVDILTFGEKEYRMYGLRHRQMLKPIGYTNEIKRETSIFQHRDEERDHRRPISEHYYDDNYLHRVSRNDFEDGRLHSVRAAAALSEYDRGGDREAVPVSSRYLFSRPSY